MPYLPRFSYAVTRDIRWRLEPLAYVLAVIAIGFLIPVNYALTGYETVTQPNTDYNYVPHHWYTRFTRAPKPGTFCDAYRLNIGDSFVTGPSIFTYQLASILGDESASAASSIPYKGQTLEYCDVASLSVTADARLQTSTIVAGIACTAETEFPVTLTTTVHTTAYDSVTSTYEEKGSNEVGDLVALNSGSLPVNVSYLVTQSSADLIGHFVHVFRTMPGYTGPALLSVSTNETEPYPPWWCSTAVSGTNTTCATTVPPISDTLRTPTLLDVDGYKVIYNSSLPSNYTLAINNLMEVMLAAVRIDLGNILPNNVLVNRSSELIANTVAQTLPIEGGSSNDTSYLYEVLVAPATNSSYYSPVDLGEGPIPPSQIALEYQCREEQRKSPGSILVAVVVATMTLFKGGWAVFVILVTFFAKRAEPEGERLCAGHEALEARIRDLERQSSTPNLKKEE
ncbi:hypothetical protein FRB95_004998 [Tulasnella sp. JGI-2019a]|nr:hypothetical protein FRB95_004998 [Tulasnella sp. JGI-2019a]